MCNPECIDFGKENIQRYEIEGKDILEIGSRDINGTLRHHLQTFNPRNYIGIDIEQDNYVDMVEDITNDKIFLGRTELFDAVISTEVMEHVENWRKAIQNMKRLVKVGGFILITTRSKGFTLHNYPVDFWRYEVSDMEKIFSDFTKVIIKPDRKSVV